jgi:hypothetical protein
LKKSPQLLRWDGKEAALNEERRREGNAQSIAAVVIAFDRLAVNEPGDRASPAKRERDEREGASPVSQPAAD